MGGARLGVDVNPMEIRLLRESDIAAAMGLKRAAGWNQTEADWRTLLQHEPNGCFAAVLDDQLVGTTTTTCYGSELAWIGMVLVRPDQRRKGIATKLLETALKYLDAKVSTVKLDATADGKHVYERIGFEVESLIERWSRSGEHVRFKADPQTIDDQMLQLDREVFGADRSRLLKMLFASSLVRTTRAGYALARSGSDAAYVGPVVTREQSAPVELLDQLLEALHPSPVYVDLNRNRGDDGPRLLSERGFAKQRNLMRMKRGPAIPTSPLIFAIAGPEVG